MGHRTADPTQDLGAPLAAPAPTPQAQKDPPPLLRVAGLVAFLALALVDSLDAEWNPDPWVYLGGVAVIVWGPAMLPSIGRKQ